MTTNGMGPALNGTASAPVAQAFGHGGLAMGANTEDTTAAGVPSGKMEGKLDYDRTLDQQGENTLSAEGQGRTGGGDLLSRVLGQGALDNNVQQGVNGAPVASAFGHGGLAMGGNTENTQASGVPSGTGARTGVAEGRPAGLTGKMEGGLDYDRSQSEVGQNTLKAEAHGNRGHGPLLSQVTGGRPGMLGDNVDPGASAVHQTTGGGYGAAPTRVAAGGVPTTGVAHHGPISGTVPSGPAFQGHQAATGAAAGGVPAAGVAHHGPISGSGPAFQGHQAATGAAAGGVPATGAAHHGPISGTVPSGPAFQGDQVAPNYPSGTSRHSAIPDSLPRNQTAGGSGVAAGGLTGPSTHQTGAGIGQSSGGALGGSNVAMPGANAVLASRNGSKKPKPLQVPYIEVTPPLLKPPKRRRVTAVEQHRSDIDSSSTFHSQRGSKILLVAACALIRGDKVLCAQRPAGKRRGGQWEFPGGKIERKENPEEALSRELREELGITTEVKDLLPLTFASMSDGEEGSRHLLMPLYVCRRWGNEPRGLENQALRWETADTLPELNWVNADQPLIHRVQCVLRGELVP